MSKRIQEYVMTAWNLLRLQRSRGKVICYTCDRELKVNDRVVSADNKHGRSVLRCRDCAVRINLI